MPSLQLPHLLRGVLVLVEVTFADHELGGQVIEQVLGLVSDLDRVLPAELAAHGLVVLVPGYLHQDGERPDALGLLGVGGPDAVGEGDGTEVVEPRAAPQDERVERVLVDLQWVDACVDGPAPGEPEDHLVHGLPGGTEAREQVHAERDASGEEQESCGAGRGGDSHGKNLPSTRPPCARGKATRGF